MVVFLYPETVQGVSFLPQLPFPHKPCHLWSAQFRLPGIIFLGTHLPCRRAHGRTHCSRGFGRSFCQADSCRVLRGHTPPTPADTVLKSGAIALWSLSPRGEGLLRRRPGAVATACAHLRAGPSPGLEQLLAGGPR